jgi:uncharacterized protein YfaS (alpha-2-macroglobulin family)
MFKRRTVIALALLAFLIFIGVLWALIDHYVHLPARVSQMETLVLGQSRFVPGTQSALRVVVRDLSDQEPIADAAVKVLMQPVEGGRAITLFQGSTDAQGAADVDFTVPADLTAAQTLIVETKSYLGEDRLDQSVTVDRDYKILLTTDKPLYQPGQIIHIRALALSTFDRVPASGQEIEFTIADGKGNKVFRETVKTSEYGIASVDFQLASEVNTGPYKISALMGNTSSEATVTVEHYVLPKFEVTLTPDRSFYLPREHVSGSLNAEYFFGKKVAGGQVLIEGFTFDFERQVWVTQQGMTDENGSFAFEFDLPEYIVGTELEGGMGRFYLQASVTDLAQHTEQSSLSLPVSQSRLVIEAIPESGQIRPKLENIIYILTSYPDGAPAKTTLRAEVSGQSFALETGSYGLATLQYTPDSPWLELQLSARDQAGNLAERLFSFEGTWEEETVLLRPDHAAYRIGDTMHLDMLTSASSGNVYLDIVREGQTVSTRTVEITEGKGQVDVDLSPDHFGTLELHAYKILSSGHIVRDTRLVVVDAPTDLILAITSDQDEYRPGENAALDFLVSGQDGVGAQSALGLAIVDESVFALAEQDPGFAKLYFMLEAELLRPKYDIHGFSVPDLVGPPPYEPAMREALEGAAQASLADAAALVGGFGLNLNSHDKKIQIAYEKQEAFFGGVTTVLLGIGFAFPLAVVGLTFVGLRRKRVLGRSLILLVLLFAGLTLVFLLIPVPEWYGDAPLDRLGFILESVAYRLEGLGLILFLAGFTSFIALAVYAWRARDWTLGWALIITVAFVPFLILLTVAASLSDLSPDESVLMWSLLALALLPLAYLLRAMGFGASRQIGWALAAFLVAPFLLIGSVFPLMIGGPSIGSVRQGLDGEVMMDFAAMEAMPPAMIPVEDAMPKAAETPSPAPGEPPHLRQYFPETMFWQPEAITDANGFLRLELPMADSITTWRLTALASTQDGRLGASTTGVRVFQDFFIDLDLPVALTQNDEIAVPVGVFNYLPEAQTVCLEIEQASWFQLLDDTTKEITIASNDIDVVYFRIKAVDFGRQALKVTALGSRMSDAIQKEVSVHPDGKPIAYTSSDRMTTEGATEKVEIPIEAIPGTQHLAVKIYPGVVSQVVEGLDNILRMPYGCFEQTSSITYPNVLVLDYLQTTQQASPETQFKAEEYINLGYQRLMTFEVSGGGFSLFGDSPADRMLTAYGLQEFSDMSHVHNVDQAIIDRAAEWLLGQQESDGSWKNDRGLVHEDTWSKLENDSLPVTAYIAWSLIEAGYADDVRTQNGLAYVREHLSQANDPYVLAFVANALVAADLEGGQMTSSTTSVLEKLAAMAQYEGQAAYWTSSIATFMGSEGQTGSIETTALAAFAFIRANSHPDVGNAALTYLVREKDSFGTWYNTQATVLSLKALIQSVRAGSENVDATVTVTLNDGQEHTIKVTPENFDIVQSVSFEDISPGIVNTVAITMNGEGNLMYQVSGEYYIPWGEVIALQEGAISELITFELEYDRTELTVDDTTQVDVTVTMNEPGRAEWALIDLGIPPGFTVVTDDLNALVSRFEDVPEVYELPTIERYELTGRQIMVYTANLSHEHALAFSFRMKAKFPIKAKTPASNAYDYYNPDLRGESAPVLIVVNP